jgi:Heterokaryon incompatibility protein (HET)
MWLINVNNFELESFFDADIPEYAILSHTWVAEEVTFKDMQQKPLPELVKCKAGFYKINQTCQQTRADGYDYAWVDTCCIDKSSSAELQESINSMFRWYHDSAVCYAYLSDVTKLSDFRSSRWFTRGWTLQELLAPLKVLFYSDKWSFLGSRFELSHWIEPVTRIGAKYLKPKNANKTQARQEILDASVAERMSWMWNRKTSRKEDIAYCLLGLFNISMPLLYGEGDYAFIRLQEQILSTYDDASLFAWLYSPNMFDDKRNIEAPHYRPGSNGYWCSSQSSAFVGVKSPIFAAFPSDFWNSAHIYGIGSSFLPRLIPDGLEMEIFV